MPHFDAQGREEWVCQKGGHICTGASTWVGRSSLLSELLQCQGNVCETCLAHSVSVRGKCWMCHTPHYILVRPLAFVAWHEGSLIQDAMPELTVAEREFLISQTCGQCFDKLFAEEE